MLYALVKQEGVFNTRVRLVGEAPKTDNLDDEVARRNNGNRDYVRNYSTDDDVPPQRNRGWYDNGSRSYYYRVQPYYERRYYGRGFPFGW